MHVVVLALDNHKQNLAPIFLIRIDVDLSCAGKVSDLHDMTAASPKLHQKLWTTGDERALVKFVCLHDDRKSPSSTAVWPSKNPSDPYWKEADQYIETTTGQSCLGTANFLTYFFNIQNLPTFIHWRVFLYIGGVYCVFMSTAFLFIKFGSYFQLLHVL